MNKGRQRPFAAIVQTHFEEALAAGAAEGGGPKQARPSRTRARLIVPQSPQPFLLQYFFSDRLLEPGSRQ